ncbi:SGNH/GDSL hydrolase family protein [Limoniibacter endophyticus]|uniref:SGNH hydrolase-type esterase domain-containing protein n=1 Tax=Limoniibacter endophyticus TaxID=1565040 RepID=A0A8J3DJZ6_9HYPH|nr:SGNH/GDSL hydrolase family protein [Limoniibacter endophyticus]GHC63087.1 hypothetical protein GCM10010136_04610 [Limoniibacter endophyticus]
MSAQHVSTGRSVLSRRLLLQGLGLGFTTLAVNGITSGVNAQTMQSGAPLKVPLPGEAPLKVRTDRQLGTIVIFGSSTAAGCGTSMWKHDPTAENGWDSPPSSWAGRFRAALAGRATVINRSIGGTNTADSLKRFDTDVVPHAPNFVILATGWANQVGKTPKERAQSYINDALTLVRKVRAIGAVPIVICDSPLSVGDNAARVAQFEVGRAMDANGILRWSFCGTAATDTFGFMPGLTPDNYHGNDVAHEAYFDAVDIGMLDMAVQTSSRRPVSADKCGAWTISETSPTRPAVRIAPFYRPRSFTAILTFKPAVPAADMVHEDKIVTAFNYVEGGEEKPLRLVAGDRYRVLAEGSDRVLMESDLPATDGVPHQHALVYNHLRDELRWYMDGKMIDAVSGLRGGERLVAFTAGGADGIGQAPVGSVISGLLFYRTAHLSAEISRIYSGDVGRGSLSADVVDGALSGGVAINTVTTRLDLAVSGVAAAQSPSKNCAPAVALNPEAAKITTIRSAR